ncbi:MAG: hypothetical protein EXR72_00160 [Myxococcales bacterium]|nr:hypothetical protein [Myxococcales bacterium]
MRAIRIVLALATAALFGCSGASRPLGDEPLGDGGAGGDMKLQPTVEIRVKHHLKNKVDVLFMVDNSNSMSAMSNQLKDRFGQFFKVFKDLADKGTYADLQIGVASSDYGAGSTGAPAASPLRAASRAS